MTIGDLQASSNTPFMNQLQAGIGHYTPVLRYLQSLPAPSKQINQGSLVNLRTPGMATQPSNVTTNVTPTSQMSLLSNGKLVENYLTSRQLVGGSQVRAGII